MVFSNAVYDKLKWIALILLPALSVLYLSLAKFWPIPYPEEISGTIMAIDVFLGAILQISSNNYNNNQKEIEKKEG